MLPIFIDRLSTMSCDVNWTKAKDDRITNWYWNKQASYGTFITFITLMVQGVAVSATHSNT